jgi:hypothetical protein
LAARLSRPSPDCADLVPPGCPCVRDRADRSAKTATPSLRRKTPVSLARADATLLHKSAEPMIHALVDTHALPVRLALTTIEAHGNRLAGKLSPEIEKNAARRREGRLGQHPTTAAIVTAQICFIQCLDLTRNLVASIRSITVAGLQRAARHAANDLAFVQLASVCQLSRVNESTS